MNKEDEFVAVVNISLIIRGFDELDAVARELNTHPVCLLCSKPCKKHYSFWSFQMPPQEFCGDFEENPDKSTSAIAVYLRGESQK